jgi:drug/metabolite transporter (DMT)-like permease
VALAAVGLAVLAGGVADPSLLGSLLTLGGALCFAGHIAGLSQWATRENAVGLTAASVAVATLLCALAAVIGGGVDVPPDGSTWAAVAYLALVATCAGFVVQAWAQSTLSATTAAVVMTSEPVFAALIASAAGEGGLGIAGWVGGLLVVAAMFVAELGPRRCCDALSPRVECC